MPFLLRYLNETLGEKAPYSPAEPIDINRLLVPLSGRFTEEIFRETDLRDRLYHSVWLVHC